jgi:hypothetical protein
MYAVSGLYSCDVKQMSKLKFGTIEDDKPVKLTIELPAGVYRNLVAYAEAIGRESGQAAPESYQDRCADNRTIHVTDRASSRARKVNAKYCR